MDEVQPYVVLGSPNPVLIDLLSYFPPITCLALGILVGWLLGKGSRRQALASLLVGGVLVYLGYRLLLTLTYYSKDGIWRFSPF